MKVLCASVASRAASPGAASVQSARGSSAFAAAGSLASQPVAISRGSAPVRMEKPEPSTKNALQLGASTTSPVATSTTSASAAPGTRANPLDPSRVATRTAVHAPTISPDTITRPG
ncbi:MAG: hypothetical protein R3F34_18145 [Planctomycetota bacterium]